MKKIAIMLAVFAVIGVIPALRFSNDGVLLSNALAEGLGRTIAIAALSSLGLLYRRNRTLGFGIAAIIFSILSLVAETKMQKTANETSRFSDESADTNLGLKAPSQTESAIQSEFSHASQSDVPALKQTDLIAGVNRFQKSFHSGGFSAVPIASRACHDEVSRSTSWSSIDECQAFDFAASEFAKGLSVMGGGSHDQFFGSDLTSQAASLYAPLNADPLLTTQRLQAIQDAVKTIPGKSPITMGQVVDALDRASNP